MILLSKLLSLKPFLWLLSTGVIAAPGPPPPIVLPCVPIRRGGNGGPDCREVVEDIEAVVPVRLGRGGGISVGSRGGDDDDEGLSGAMVEVIGACVDGGVESMREDGSDLCELIDKRFGFGGGIG